MSWDPQYQDNYQYDAQYDQYGGYPAKKPADPVQQTFYNPNQYQSSPLPGNGQDSSFGTYGGSEYNPGYLNPTGIPQAGGRLTPAGISQGQAPAGHQQFLMPGTGMLQDPMVTNLAMSYGRDFVGKGQEEIKKNLDKYVSIGQLKYYFAVDNSYVSKKLGLILFPFTHKDWSIRYNHDEPVQPRFELNAADLYIPSMAFVTYILVVGYMLGVQERFSPEMLATTASGALTALFLEILIVYLCTTVMSITSTLAKWDFLAFSMYKYVGMIFSLFSGFLLSKLGYYSALLYSTLALAIFLFRTLHLRIEPEVHGVESHGKRKIWLIMLMVIWQPLVMWWLTYSLVPTQLTSTHVTEEI
ncbi:protein YIF1B-A [Eurytemora carolleeae]|uniref:protein YIF1B-A n=1 Tax=Eurytemora carolleeae TaxID=1294199 RepID=UPI000C790759|nr:protein YIF1B-A [Eurytemora carolleeae]|eukprot:XP_023321357.1 protein YIF1B-A-like [Eurytemora affinis]